MFRRTDTMHFSNEFLDKLEIGRSKVPQRYQDLAWIYLTRNYRDPQAREYAVQGFSRRLQTLARCIDNVFRVLPPHCVEPSKDEISDAMINIQAFVFNAFGSIDNLAWIWVKEKPVLEDGSPIRDRDVGLGKDKRVVRSSLSTAFQEYLKGLDDLWFVQLKKFRHALAHKIPLYIPPYVVPQSKLADYRQLEDRIAEAEKRKDFAACEHLRAEQKALGAFRPIMTSSFQEGSGLIIKFHPQLLADFLTIEELGKKMLKELDQLAPPGALSR